VTLKGSLFKSSSPTTNFITVITQKTEERHRIPQKGTQITDLISQQEVLAPNHLLNTSRVPK